MGRRIIRGIRVAPEYIPKVKSALARKGLTQNALAEDEEVLLSRATVQSFLNGKRVERENFIRICDRLGLDWQKIADIEIDEQPSNPEEPPPDNPIPPSVYPEEFRALIEEKIRSFCGRKFVFDAFDQFINNHSNGYFTVVGDAGMGKSAIAAKYISQNHFPCYFNILAERRNRAELFLKSIRQQLINRYQLPEAEDTELSSLLAKASQKLAFDQRLVIVVDALDEVDQEPGPQNLLYLPETLPNRVYFLLTRRPYTLDKKRLRVSVPVQELDLTASQYIHYNRDDVKEYIRLFLNEENGYQEALKNWIQNREICEETFIEQVSIKSENNFMYLRYVLPAIARGFYDDLALRQLPDGLQDYYQTHWVRMGMDTAPKEMMVIILFILVEIGTPIPCEMMAEIAQEDEFEVQTVLDEWCEYLKPQILDEEICYSIYHASFLEFLKGKRELKATRKLFQQVNQRIVDYFRKFNSVMTGEGRIG
jgi:transcriptional regulator with XRE-family HTH domain